MDGDKGNALSHMVSGSSGMNATEMGDQDAS